MTPAGWARCSVKDVAAPTKNSLVGGPFGSNLVSLDYVPAGVPVIRGQNMGSGRWVQGDFVSVSREKAEDLSPNTARPGDLIFTQRGTLGQVAIVPSHPYDRYIVSQSQMKLTVNSDIADVLFVYYYFKAPQQQDYIKRSTIQTGVPHTNLELLRTTPVILPPLLEQRAIAGVLGALDDKIELNRRMNDTLEAMARAVFKSWFVDLDPVRAKADGRQPAGMDAATAALFPDSFEDLKLREIPKGWQVGTLGDIATALRRTTDPGDIEAETPYIGLEHMPRRSIALAEWGHAADVTSTKNRFHAKEILFGKLRPYFHKVGLAPIDGVCSTDILTIRPVSDTWLPFVLLHLSSTEVVNHAHACSTGTKMPRVNWEDLAAYEVVVPPSTPVKVFKDFADPLFTLLVCNLRESRTLAALRDTLLPKLLSGEIRVKAAEKMVAGAL